MSDPRTHAEASPFATLERAFATLTTEPRPLALDGTGIPGLPDRLIPLDELRTRLLHPSARYATRDAALEILIGRARAERGAWIVGGLVELVTRGIEEDVFVVVDGICGTAAPVCCLADRATSDQATASTTQAAPSAQEDASFAWFSCRMSQRLRMLTPQRPLGRSVSRITRKLIRVAR